MTPASMNSLEIKGLNNFIQNASTFGIHAYAYRSQNVRNCSSRPLCAFQGKTICIETSEESICHSSKYYKATAGVMTQQLLFSNRCCFIVHFVWQHHRSPGAGRSPLRPGRISSSHD